METVKRFGSGDYKLEVSKSKTTIVSSTGERPGADEISVCINDGEKRLKANKQLIAINLSKHEAIVFAIHLLKMSIDDVPDNGFTIETYQEYGVSVYQAKEDNGMLANEPIICIDGITPEEITDDGCISICIGNESTKELISLLAKIV